MVTTVNRGSQIQEVVNDYYGTEYTTPMKQRAGRHRVLKNTCIKVRSAPLKPEGCIRADCRETKTKWTEDDAIDIQQIAALLPFMVNIEMREGFTKATEDARVFRDSDSQSNAT